ncbi:hypothetical protein ACP4OV_001495 [Aristida adscensionis]
MRMNHLMFMCLALLVLSSGMASEAVVSDGGSVGLKDVCRTTFIPNNCDDSPSSCQGVCDDAIHFGKVTGTCVPPKGCQCTVCKP